MRFSAQALSLVVSVGALIPMASQAANVGDGVTAIAPDSAVLNIPVTASVGTTCGTTVLPNPTITYPDLTAALSSNQITLPIKCSAAFRIGVVSSNGGMKSASPVVTGYSNLRNYNVSLNIVDDASAVHAAGPCLASTMKTGGSCSSMLGPSDTSGLSVGAASNGAGSYLQVSDAPVGSNILVTASDYTDTLTITLSATP